MAYGLDDVTVALTVEERDRKGKKLTDEFLHQAQLDDLDDPLLADLIVVVEQAAAEIAAHHESGHGPEREGCPEVGRRPSR